MHHHNIQVNYPSYPKGPPIGYWVGSLDRAHLNGAKHKVWSDCLKWDWISLGIGGQSGLQQK